MADQLFLFNLIDGSPAVPVEIAPVSAAPPKPKPAPPKLVPKEPTAYVPAVIDLVAILPFIDQNGNKRGKFLKTHGVVMGFNRVGMALVDVGTPGSLYAASPWRLVKMDD